MIDECPLLSVKRTLGDRILQTFKLMSAFLQSGRSERQNLREIRVRFRPEADLRDGQESTISGPERCCDDTLPTRGLSENAGELDHTR